MKGNVVVSREEKIQLFGEVEGIEPEWLDEPDHYEWEYLGLKCLLIRNCVGGWCGYVYAPLYLVQGLDQNSLDVHGRVSFDEESEGGLRLLGFDCCHAYDLVPGLAETQLDHRKEFLKQNPTIPLKPLLYKNLEFAKKEAESLADQIKAYIDAN